MNFNQYIKGDALILPQTVTNIGELVSFLQSNTCIVKLNLSCSNVSNKDVKELVKLTKLVSLSLLNNNISNESIRELTKLVNLTVLSLSYNNIDDRSTKELAKLTKLTSLSLSKNNISDKGIRELIKLTSLASLDLSDNYIGDRSTEELIKLTKLISLDVSVNNIYDKGAEVLARFQYSQCVIGKKCRFRLGSAQGIYDFLVELYFRNQSVNKLSVDSIKKVIFSAARDDYLGNMIKYILKRPDEYPFLINSKNEQGYTLFHFYNHTPEIQKLLFEYGLVSNLEPEQDIKLRDIIQDTQSIHATPVVRKTSFITKTLVELIKADVNELEQAIASYVKNIPELLERYQNDQVRLKLLSIDDNEKEVLWKAH